MTGELMSCLTCLRVQPTDMMLTVENPVRGGASMQSFKLCMGCASAIAEAFTAAKSPPADGAAEVKDGTAD